MAGKKTKKTQNCSICGRERKQTGAMVEAAGLSICERCVYQCAATFDAGKEQGKILDQSSADKNPETQTTIYTPKELHRFLDDFVIGQDTAKKILSVAVYNHYKRLDNNLDTNLDGTSVEIDKSNILMMGPTGSGKTLLAKTLANVLEVPFAIADATTLTEAGYVGDDVENILKGLLVKCDYDVTKAQRGIIFLDEIDKISRRSDNTSITRDVSGEGVQQAMLKLIEGTIASVPQEKRKHPGKETIDIDTKNILFICGGAFDGLEKIVQQRIDSNNGIGFSATVSTGEKENLSKLFSLVEPDDLVKYGLIPEIVGRLTVHTSLEELDERSLIKILTKPKNAVVKQFQEFFNMENIKLDIKPSALTAIAKLAIKRKTGARGLRSILEKVLLDTMYETPSQNNIDKIIIDKSVIEQKSEPLIIKHKRTA